MLSLSASSAINGMSVVAEPQAEMADIKSNIESINETIRVIFLAIVYYLEFCLLVFVLKKSQ